MESPEYRFKQAHEHIDRFEILSILGQGGMGVVYKAHDPILDKDVALKLIRSDLGSYNIQLRFQQEAKALKNLKHNSIPEIYDFAISEDGDPFMVIEFIKGISLRDYLKEKKNLSLKEALDIIEPLCNALEYAHGHSIIHRDLKPDNIIITKDDSGKNLVKVIDFGLARIELEPGEERTQRITETGNVLGSPKYMSPEQARGRPASKATDTYSLGCILFELLAGRPPYLGKSSLETITMHVTHDIGANLGPLPETYRNGTVSSIICKAMAKEPEERYRSINEIGSELKAYLEESQAPVIEIPEFDSPKSSSSEILKLSSIFLVATIVILGIAKLGYDQFSKHFDKTAIATEKLSDNITKIEKQESNDKGITGILYKSGFVHKPEKGKGYYSGSENIIDNDFASLRKKPVEPVFITSNRSYTITGSGIYYLRGKGVKRLDLESPKLEDAVLENAALLPKLFDLTIGKTDNLTVKGFKQLKKIKELRILNIENCKIDEAMIKEIAKLDKLFSLSLKGCKTVTDKDLITLSRMKGLNNLAIDFTDITPTGLKALTRFQNLHVLKCEFLSVTDKDLTPLIKLPLVSLDISDNKLTDSGIKTLTRSKTLLRLDAMNQAWLNDKSISEKEKESLLAKYVLAGEGFAKSKQGRRIRTRFGFSDPCK